MIPVEVSIEISKSIGEVFPFMTNSAHAFLWRSTLVAITSTPQEAIKVGSTFEERTKLLNQIVETTYEVVEWLPPRRLTYKSIKGAVPSLLFLRLEPGKNCTQVIMRVEQSLELAFPHEELLAVHTVQRILQVDLQTLKEVLENR
jgi:hypothetical protein